MIAGEDSLVDLDESTVVGTIELTESFTLLSRDSSIGNVQSTGSDFVVLFGGTVVGNMKVQAGETSTFAQEIDVGGSLEATGVAFFSLLNSTVNGSFSVRDTLGGSAYCGNTVNGNSEFTNNRALLRIGSPNQFCDGNRFNGNVVVARNVGDVETEISGNDVAGNLTCRGNVPPPVGGGNSVQGNKEGQCRTL